MIYLLKLLYLSLLIIGFGFCESQTIIHTDSTTVPYNVTTTCPVFSAQSTESGERNLVECTFELCPSDQISISYCTQGSCTGDTLILLVDTTDGRTVFKNDDYCVYCSGGSYIVDGHSCRTFSLRQGCYGDSSCGGQANLDRIKIYFNPIPPAEVSALASLYDSTDGNSWLWPEGAKMWDFTNSSVVDNLCSVWYQWYGVFCDCVSNTTNCFVTELRLIGLGLKGDIGEVPFNRLTHLHTLDLSDNELYGPIPPHVSALGNLLTVNLQKNFFSGTLPSYLTSLNDTLKALRLSDNNLEGTIPDFLRIFGVLETLEFGSNMLEGTLADCVCALPKLLVLNVGGNNLHGFVPDCLYVSSNTKNIMDLDLHSNNFVGSLKEQIINLAALNVLKLSSNQFTGTIPPGVFRSVFTAWIFLDRNHFHGTIHRNISRIRYLRDLDLSYNHLSGTLISGLTKLENLIYFNIEHNKFSGDLHGKFNFSVQPNLQSLVLGANKFTGTLPRDLFRPGLITFSAYDNCLENYVPKAICNAKTLKTLVLDGMQTSPYCKKGSSSFLSAYKQSNSDALVCLISKMPRIRVLHLSSLALRGNVLESVESVGKYLDHMSLSYNHLTGTIPVAIQRKRWRSLDLSFNFFTGELVEDFNSVMIDPGDDDATDDDGDDDVINYIPNDDYYRFNASIAYASDVFLDINHLSGQVPSTLLGKGYNRKDLQVSILDGNLFSCNYDKDQIPRGDPAWERYDCGSNSFNASYYFYLAAFGFLAIVLITFVRYFHLSVLSVGVFAWNFASSALSKNDMPRHPDLENRDLPNIYAFYRGLNYIEKVFVVVLVYLLLWMTPVYSALSAYRATYKYSYAWSVSAAYKEGLDAAVVELVSFAVFLIVLSLVWQHPERCVDVFSVVLRKQSTTAIAESATAVGVARAKSVVTAPPTTSMIVASSLKWIVMFSVEIGVVGAMNLLFVYVNIVGTRSQVFAVQVALTVFGLVWTSQNIEAITTFVESKFSHVEHTENAAALYSAEYYINRCGKRMEIARHHYSLQLIMAALNNVWISVIIVALVSRSCFFYSLVTPDTIESSYVYKTCVDRTVIATILYCTKYGYQKLATAFTPLFTYSFQCSSVVIVYFAPSLMYTCAIDSFIMPCFQLSASWLLRRRGRTKTVHSTDDDVDGRLSIQNTTLIVGKRRSLYERLVKLFKKACVTSFLVPMKVTKVKRAVTASAADAQNTPIIVEELDEALEDSESSETDEYYVYFRMASHYSGEIYLSATQEAVKMLGYMFLALTFGFVFPPLGVAICATAILYIRFLQWKMRSFVSKVWGYSHYNLKGELPPPTSGAMESEKLDSLIAKSAKYRKDRTANGISGKGVGSRSSRAGGELLPMQEEDTGKEVAEEVLPFSSSEKSLKQPQLAEVNSLGKANAMACNALADLDGEEQALLSLSKKVEEGKRGLESSFSCEAQVYSSAKSNVVDEALSCKISRVVSFHLSSKVAARNEAEKAKDWAVDKETGSTGRQMALHSCLVALNEQCTGFSDMFYNARWTVLGTASVFYAFFLFDTAGSKEGFSGSYWTLIVSLLLPVCIYVLYTRSHVLAKVCRSISGKGSARVAAEGVYGDDLHR